MKNLILISHGNSEYTPELGETELSRHGIKQIMIICMKFKLLIGKYDNAMWFGTTYLSRQIAKIIGKDQSERVYLREFEEKLLDNSDNIKELAKKITDSPCGTNLVIADRKVLQDLLAEWNCETEVPEGRIVYLNYDYGNRVYTCRGVIG